MEEQTGDTSSVSDWLPDRRIYPKLRLISGQWNPPCHDTVKRPRALSAEGGQVASSLPSSSWSNILFEPLGTKWHRRRVFQSKSEVWWDETVKKDTQIWQYFFFFFSMTINLFCFLQPNTGRCSPRGTKTKGKSPTADIVTLQDHEDLSNWRSTQMYWTQVKSFSIWPQLYLHVKTAHK